MKFLLSKEKVLLFALRDIEKSAAAPHPWSIKYEDKDKREEE